MRLVIALAVALLAPQDTVELRWKFKKGEALRYEMKQTTEAEFGGMELKQEFLFGWLLEPTEVTDEGLAAVKMTYDRVRVLMTGPMETDYDSDRDKEAPEDILGRVMSAFHGKSFTMKINGLGEVLEVKGLQEIMEAAMKDLPEEQAPMAEMMKQSYNEETMKKMMGQFFGLVPSKAVKKGDSWDRKGEMPMGASSVKSKSKFTLKEIRAEGKEAVVEQDMTMEVAEEDDGMGGMMNITDCKMKSEIIWLIDRGVMQSSSGTMTMTMNAGGQEFPMETKQTMKLAPKGTKTEVPKEPKKDH